MQIPEDKPSSPIPLAYAPVIRGRGSASETVFWILFYVLGVLLGLISLLAIRSATWLVVLLEVALVVWLVSAVLHVMKHRLRYLMAGVWTALLWAPMCLQVVRRLHYWVTVGMEPPDGMGSPLAFLMGFAFEQLLFLPLTIMLVLLIRTKPWRGPTPDFL